MKIGCEWADNTNRESVIANIDSWKPEAVEKAFELGESLGVGVIKGKKTYGQEVCDVLQITPKPREGLDEFWSRLKEFDPEYHKRE